MDVFDAEDEQIVAARSAADDAGIAAKRDNADAAMEAERLRELVRKYQEKGSDGLWTRGVFGIRPGDVSVGDWDTVQLARPTSENLREQHTGSSRLASGPRGRRAGPQRPTCARPWSRSRSHLEGQSKAIGIVSCGPAPQHDSSSCTVVCGSIHRNTMVPALGQGGCGSWWPVVAC